MSNFKCYLIGPNGAGKTTVGRMLANFLSLKFIDLDLEIENLCGVSIIDFWRDKGQKVFKEFENLIIKTFSSKKDIIFSTSVHSVIEGSNRKIFTTQGKTIYLTADPVNQYTRSMLSNNPSPILYNVTNKLTYLIELEKTMKPLYNSIADFVISTDNCSIEEVANKIIDCLYNGIYY